MHHTTALPLLPAPPVGVLCNTGPLMGMADAILHNKACLARELRLPLEAIQGPAPFEGRLDRVLLDPRTLLVFAEDHSFFLHHDGRTLPFAFRPKDAEGFQRTPVVEWARGHVFTWAAVARADWTLAPLHLNAMPHPQMCPFWLPVSGMAHVGHGPNPIVSAVETLVSTTAMETDVASEGWNVDVFNGRVDHATGAFVPGFLTYDARAVPGAPAPRNSTVAGLSGRIQRILAEDGRLGRLMASHHLLVHALACDNPGRHVCGAHGVVASFRIGSQTAHAKMSGLAHLASLLDALPHPHPSSLMDHA